MFVPMPPAPTLAARITPEGIQKVAEKDAAAPPADVPGPLPPPPPTSVAVTVHPPAGALKFCAGAAAIERPVPKGRISPGGVTVGVALGVGDVEGVEESVPD